MIAKAPRRAGLFFPFAAAVVAVKLVLTSRIAILPVEGPYDEINYVYHAFWITRGAWFGPYDQFTLIKMPFFPIFLSGIDLLQIPLPLAHQVLYAAAAFVACAAVGPIVPEEGALCVLFAFLLFNPYTFDQTAWYAQRSEISGSLALLSVGCACAVFVRRTASIRVLALWSVAFGMSFSAFWLTREESVWLVPGAILPLVSFGLATRSFGARERAERIALLLVPPAILALSIAAVTSINAAHYGWPTIVENETPEFLGAYDSLARIRHRNDDPLVPVPKESLEVAYRASAAARELRPGFTGSAAAKSLSISCSFMHECSEVAGGWFIWLFRHAAFTGGNMKSGAGTRAYFVRLAHEIDRACDAGAIACKAKKYGLFPNAEPRDLPVLLRTYGLGIVAFFSGAGYTLLPTDGDKRPAYELPFYRAVTGNVAAALPSRSRTSAVLSLIAQTYRYLMPWLTLATAACLVLRVRALLRTRSLRSVGTDAVIASGVFASIFVLIGILAVIQTYSFTAFFPEYFNPGYAILYFGIGIVLSTEAARLRERYRSRVRPSTSGLA